MSDTELRGPAPAPYPVPGALPEVGALPEAGFAVLDVETTGFGEHDRIVQIALVLLDRQGRVQREWSSLVNPMRNPGPVHIHGITPQRLSGAPPFAMIAVRVAGLLAGRVLVAHNADFDYRMVHTELVRAQVPDPVRWRLCTMRLARRLDIPVDSYSLARLAEYYQVHNPGAHDARYDTETTVHLLAHLRREAARVGADLPLTVCTSSPDEGRHRVGGRRAPFVNPGRWRPGTPLTAGMSVHVVGPTLASPHLLRERTLEAGLSYSPRLSEHTSLVVCNDPQAPGRRTGSVRAAGVPVIDEDGYLALLGWVLPGESEPGRPQPERTHPPVPGPGAAPVPAHILVLGGSPARAAEARALVAAAGNRVAVRLTRAVTHVVALSGAARDPWWPLAQQLGIPAMTVQDLTAAAAQQPPVPATALDLPEGTVWVRLWLSWRQCGAGRPGLQVRLEGAAGDLLVPADLLTGDNPAGDDGAVTLDVATGGEAGVQVRLRDLDPGYHRLVLGRDGAAGPGGPLGLRVRGSGGLHRHGWLEPPDPAGDGPGGVLRLERTGTRWRLVLAGGGFSRAGD